MRTLDEIRTEMANSAYQCQIALEEGLQVPAERHAAWYAALEWVLQEPWKADA